MGKIIYAINTDYVKNATMGFHLAKLITETGVPLHEAVVTERKIVYANDANYNLFVISDNKELKEEFFHFAMNYLKKLYNAYAGTDIDVDVFTDEYFDYEKIFSKLQDYLKKHAIAFKNDDLRFNANVLEVEIDQLKENFGNEDLIGKYVYLVTSHGEQGESWIVDVYHSELAAYQKINELKEKERQEYGEESYSWYSVDTKEIR